MTSTTQGTFTDRNSSRVLRPPGGASSNIFGFADDEPKPTKKTETAENDSAVKEQQINAAPADIDKTENQNPADENNENSQQAQPADTAVVSAKEREVIAKKSKAGSSGFNPITGEPIVEQPGADGGKQNARVRHPPGGASSKLW